MVKRFLLPFIIVFLPYGLSHADARPGLQEYRRANQLFASAQFREAILQYQKLLVSPPEGITVSDIHSRIGDSWFRLGFFQNALDSYRKAISGQKVSARPETQYWIGFCSFLLGRDAEAAKEFLKIPKLYPGSGMWVNTAYYWAGRASERMGNDEEAATYYRRAGGNAKSTQGRFARQKADAVKRKH